MQNTTRLEWSSVNKILGLQGSKDKAIGQLVPLFIYDRFWLFVCVALNEKGTLRLIGLDDPSQTVYTIDIPNSISPSPPRVMISDQHVASVLFTSSSNSTHSLSSCHFKLNLDVLKNPTPNATLFHPISPFCTDFPTSSHGFQLSPQFAKPTTLLYDIIYTPVASIKALESCLMIYTFENLESDLHVNATCYSVGLSPVDQYHFIPDTTSSLVSFYIFHNRFFFNASLSELPITAGFTPLSTFPSSLQDIHMLNKDAFVFMAYPWIGLRRQIKTEWKDEWTVALSITNATRWHILFVDDIHTRLYLCLFHDAFQQVGQVVRMDLNTGKMTEFTALTQCQQDSMLPFNTTHLLNIVQNQAWMMDRKQDSVTLSLDIPALYSTPPLLMEWKHDYLLIVGHEYTWFKSKKDNREEGVVPLFVIIMSVLAGILLCVILLVVVIKKKRTCRDASASLHSSKSLNSSTSLCIPSKSPSIPSNSPSIPSKSHTVLKSPSISLHSSVSLTSPLSHVTLVNDSIHIPRQSLESKYTLASLASTGYCASESSCPSSYVSAWSACMPWDTFEDTASISSNTTIKAPLQHVLSSVQLDSTHRDSTSEYYTAES